MKAILIGFLGLLACAAAQSNCVFTLGGANFDVRPLAATQATGDYYGTDGKYQYYINICAQCNYGGECTELGSSICQFDEGVFEAQVAAYNKTPDATWDLLAASDPSQGLVLTYRNGAACYPSQNPRVAIVTLHCNPDANLRGAFIVSEHPDDCTYYLSYDTPYACPKNGTTLSISTGRPVLGNTSAYTWTYWAVGVQDQHFQLRIRTNQTSPGGFIGLYTRFAALPTLNSYDRRDVTQYSSHELSLSRNDITQLNPLQTGMYYIGIYANNATIDWSIQVDLNFCPNNCSGNGYCNAATGECNCLEGYTNNKPDCSAPVYNILNATAQQGTVYSSNVAYYRFNINDPNEFQMIVSLTYPKGSANPTVLIARDRWPTNTIGGYDAYISDPFGQYGSLEATLMNPTLDVGSWIIAVQGSQDQVLSYSVKTVLWDCPNGCSGHGTCNAEIHRCACDYGWAIATDCSVEQKQLTPGAGYASAITVQAFETEYVVVWVPQEVADARIDLAITVSSTSTGGLWPQIVVNRDKLPTSTEWIAASPEPLAALSTIYITDNDLRSGYYYVGILNLYDEDISVQAKAEFNGYCNCKHGTCPANEPGICICDSGWKGVVCDISTAEDSGLDTGIFVFLIFLFLALGVALGMFVSARFPHLFDKFAGGGDSLRSRPLVSGGKYGINDGDQQTAI